MVRALSTPESRFCLFDISQALGSIARLKDCLARSTPKWPGIHRWNLILLVQVLPILLSASNLGGLCLYLCIDRWKLLLLFVNLIVYLVFDQHSALEWGFVSHGESLTGLGSSLLENGLELKALSHIDFVTHIGLRLLLDHAFPVRKKLRI